MKKLILFFCLCAFLSCKKDNVDDITKVNWVLETATVNPAMTFNGKASTNYKNLMGEGSCLASNYTLIFLSTGIYQFASNGALCDMVANSDNQKWVQDGSKITLTNSSGANAYTMEMIINGETITYTHNFTSNNISYSVNYVYRAQTK